MHELTATEVLRRLLDERGVEWWQSANTLGCIFTRWHSPIFGDEVVAMENGDGELELFSHLMTPEQAIAATLGAGTCHNVWDVELTGRLRFQCSECGGVSLEITPNFCPVCGRKVVEPTTNVIDTEVEQ